MYQYTVSQWMLFFSWYCFIGWIWECSYVSIKEAIEGKGFHWINRGFLHGPVIPIYGFAAITILIATIPVRDHIWLIFIFGALAASLMELVTGSLMERMFHIKYWDYSDLPWNYKGHVCFFVSLFWGLLSVLMVKWIHVPVEKFVMEMSGFMTEISAFVLVILFTYDFKESLQEAMDMKELLEKLHDYKDVVQRVEKRMDSFIAFMPKVNFEDAEEHFTSQKERFLYKVENLREQHVFRLKELRCRLEALGEAHEEGKELSKLIEKQIRGVFARSNNQYLRVRKHLKRNPRAISKKYEEVLREIKDLFE